MDQHPASTCVQSGEWTNFYLNSILHILILTSILSCFFFLYVSKLSSQKFQDEMSDIIGDNMTGVLDSANTQSNGQLKTSLKNIDFSKLQNYYANATDKATNTENDWLKKITIAFIVFLIVLLVASLSILYISCGRCTDFANILKENLIVFLFIGIAEVTFFMFIARKFIPTKPSLIMNTIVGSLKNIS